MEKKNGFTILEMMIVMLIVALLLLITLPNIQQKEKIIRNKGCEALLEIVNSQIMLYEIDQLETPTSVQELIDFGYLKKEVEELDRAGIDIFHCDIMDGIHVRIIVKW